jgi:hypothetical protein
MNSIVCSINSGFCSDESGFDVLLAEKFTTVVTKSETPPEMRCTKNPSGVTVSDYGVSGIKKSTREVHLGPTFYHHHQGTLLCGYGDLLRLLLFKLGKVDG